MYMKDVYDANFILTSELICMFKINLIHETFCCSLNVVVVFFFFRNRKLS